MNLLGLPEAAQFLRISTDTLRDLAAAGTVPAAKISKEWIFSQEDLAAYVKAEIARQTKERRGGQTVPAAYARTVRHKSAPPPPLN